MGVVRLDLPTARRKTAVIGVARDISEQKKNSEHLVQLATYDSLTG